MGDDQLFRKQRRIISNRDDTHFKSKNPREDRVKKLIFWQNKSNIIDNFGMFL